MLRRKMLITMLGLTALLMVLALGALWALQGIVTQLDQIAIQTGDLVDSCGQLVGDTSAIEVELYQLRPDRPLRLEPMIRKLAEDSRVVEAMNGHVALSGPSNAAVYLAMRDRLGDFSKTIQSLSAAGDLQSAKEQTAHALAASARLRDAVARVTAVANAYARGEERDLTRRFRWLVLALAVAFLFVINLTVLTLMRWATRIVRPVERLVEASRMLAHERFDWRVNIDQKDEFDELARTSNWLAEKLQSNETRKIETLGQMALALNHELNNAMSIIEMQLALLGRSGDPNEASQKRLTQIRSSLERMAKTVESLKHVRRIVLTQYTNGQQMLDLARSTQEEAVPPQPTVPKRAVSVG